MLKLQVDPSLIVVVMHVLLHDKVKVDLKRNLEICSSVTFFQNMLKMSKKGKNEGSKQTKRKTNSLVVFSVASLQIS